MKTEAFTFSSAPTAFRSEARNRDNGSENKLRKEQENIVNWARKQFDLIPEPASAPVALVVAKPGTTLRVDSYLQVTISGVVYKLALVN